MEVFHSKNVIIVKKIFVLMMKIARVSFFGFSRAGHVMIEPQRFGLLVADISLVKQGFAPAYMSVGRKFLTRLRRSD